MTALRTARAAAIGGLVFAALMAVVLFLFRAAFPVDQYLDAESMPSSEALSQARIALMLVPYAGIAFIWFTAALHYNLGSADQRLFTTVFIVRESIILNNNRIYKYLTLSTASCSHT